MSKQKAIGYVRSSRRGDASTEAQKQAIQSYCEEHGYELISNYETSTPLVPEQIDALEAYVRDQLGLRDTTVKLIPAAMNRIGRDIGTVQSMIISLHDKCIEIEPADSSEQICVGKAFDTKRIHTASLAKHITIMEEHMCCEIDAIAHALQEAFEWDQSNDKFQEIRAFVEDNYDPEISKEESFPALLMKYAKHYHAVRSAMGKSCSHTHDAERYVYGYKKVDGKLIVDMIEAENIKWMFHMVLQYTEHPPVSLVEAVIESAAAQGETITYEDAEKRVSYDAILHYMGRELNLKNKLFAHESEKTPEALQEILSLSLEEAEARYTEVAEEIVAESVAWTCRIKHVLPKPSFYQPTALCEPIISAETYSAAQQAMQSKLSM